MLAKKNPT